MAVLGCGGAAQYGSFIEEKPQVQAAIGTDAAKKLARNYPAERHKIWVAQQTEDAFGRGFAAALREQGYAVETGEEQGPGPKLAVRYVLDAVKGTPLLRLTLYVQRRRLSRAYAERPDGLYPAGPWVGER
jgi:hypothetical protein